MTKGFSENSIRSFYENKMMCAKVSKSLECGFPQNQVNETPYFDYTFLYKKLAYKRN